MTSPDHIDFFWRPGCGFCMLLERRLNKRGIPYAKFNIWEDPAHADYVRSVAGGNETVPTVRVGNVGLVNPSLDAVVQAMRAETPDLIPAD